ncbi:MAG: 30S ribosomal protein S17 [Thermoguttaceae bacterium]
MPKKIVTGIVTRDKAMKTRRVEVTRLVRHPRYGKILRRRTVCTAHDEENQSHAGDLVEIEESRPLSRTKRWKLLRVLTKGPSRDISAPSAGASIAVGDLSTPAGDVATEEASRTL